MAYEIGFVDDTGAEGIAHWQMLEKIKTLAVANGWTVLSYLKPTGDTAVRELILKAAGLSGTEEIYIGFRAYQSAAFDYYNLSAAVLTGYVDGNTFTTQPGYAESGIPAHNQRVDYWLCVNAQRITFALKVGAGYYQHGYAGKFFPYGTPSQYPYPVFVAGMLNGVPATRYSDAVYSMGIRGSNNSYAAFARVRDVAGTWQNFFNSAYNAQGAIRDTGGYYLAKKCCLYNTNQCWGELDGVRWISGFNMAVEDTCVIDGNTNVVFRDVTRTGFNDYFLLELI